jgi:hypothetical protein
MRYAEALYESTYLMEKRLQEVLPIAATIGAGATAAKGFLVKKAGQFTAQFAAKKGLPALKKAAVGAAAPTALKRGIIKRTTGGVLAGPKKFFAKGASQAKKKVVGGIGGGIKAKGISIGPSVNVGTKRKIGLKSFSSTSKAKTLKAGPRGAPSRLEKGRTLVARGKRVGGRALTNIGIGGLGGAGVGGARNIRSYLWTDSRQYYGRQGIEPRSLRLRWDRSRQQTKTSKVLVCQTTDRSAKRF